MSENVLFVYLVNGEEGRIEEKIAIDVSAFLVNPSLSFSLRPRLVPSLRHLSLNLSSPDCILSPEMREKVNPLEIEVVSLKNFFPGPPGDKEPLYVQYFFLN